MAAVLLDALALYAKKLIEDVVEEEVHMLLGVSRKIKKLEGSTEGLKCFLADIERTRIPNQSVQRLGTKYKDVLYDFTDIIDMWHLEANKRSGSKGCSLMEENAPGCLQPFLFCLRNPAFSHKIGSRMKELDKRLDEIQKEANKFNWTINLGSNQEPRKPTDVEISSRRMTSEIIHSAIVGDKIEYDTKKLAQELITDDDNLNIKLVSIVGMGGIGKTTLAQKIINERSIQDHFKKKIWLSITQHFNETELLRTAIKQASGYHGLENDKTILTQTLTNILSNGRFLLVMDDVWGVQAWECVLKVPIINASKEQPGSRVLITTRIEDMASQMQIVFYQHPITTLDDEDAWSLLKTRLSPNKLVGVEHLESIGKEILQKCNGLPLAVKLMGGVLSTRHPSVRAWQDVLNHPVWSVTGLPEELNNMVYLSYEDLSPQLRPCFLYCSLFPKGEMIHYRKTISMWISEGFVQTPNGTSSHDGGAGLLEEELATKYYHELISRNLIEPRYRTTRFTCTMHDVVRSFADFMVNGEMLVVTHDRQAIAHGGAGSIRRLCIGQTISESFELANFLHHQKPLRTLIIMSRKTSLKPTDLQSRSFSFLRTLYIQQADSDSLVPFLCRLQYLRFLYLKDTDISRLPDDIDKLKFLEHIFLINCKNIDHLPDNIIKLKRLRLLQVPLGQTNVPKGFGGLTSLRTLYSFPVHMDKDGNGDWCSLEEIGPLSQLKSLAIQGIENVPAASSSSWAKKAMTTNKRHLHYLDLWCSSSRYKASKDEADKQQQQQAVEDAFEELRPPSGIGHVAIQGYFGRELPSWMRVHATVAFLSLRIMQLVDLPCCIQLPDGLCRLPCLEWIDIVDAPVIKRLGPEFQASSSSASGFPRMEILYLKNFCEWEEWEWEDATADAMAMPSLERLTIKNCKLGRLPPGLASSRRQALRQLHLHQLTNLRCVENFPSLVELHVFDCRELKRIGGVPRLHTIWIIRCPILEALEGAPAPAIDSLTLEDADMETLPDYLGGVNPIRYLKLHCSKKLYESLLIPDSSESQKIRHIQQRNIICIQ